jgi:hypothetical protein
VAHVVHFPASIDIYIYLSISIDRYYVGVVQHQMLGVGLATYTHVFSYDVTT